MYRGPDGHPAALPVLVGDAFYGGADASRGHEDGINLPSDINRNEALGAQIAADIAQHQLQLVDHQHLNKPKQAPVGPLPHATWSGRMYQLPFQG